MAGPARILVVDDTPASRYATVRALQGAGFAVSEAGTGTRALELCAADPPDLLVLDVHLPDLDGFEVCRRLRAAANTEQLPIVHVSATFLGEEDRVRGLDAGADAYLTHPVEPLVLVATLRAVLRARDAESALRRSEAELRAVFQRVPVGIGILDGDFRFVAANPALCAMVGRPLEELLQTVPSRWVAPFDAASVRTLEQDCRAASEWRGALAHETAGGRVVWLEWTISRHSVPDRWLTIVSDVTDRRRVEKERERQLESERGARGEAETANRLKDEFLAALSHELRTPLNAIVGWTHVLQSGQATPADVAKGLEVIQRNARLQAQLISDLLDVSRIISGKLTLDAVTLDLRELVGAALEGVEPLAQQKGVALERDLGGGAERVRGDPARLQQVIWNLVHNAIKFTPRGGRVRVRLRREGADAVVEVADNGIGISPDFLPHIFERYRQQESATARAQGGLGLGLAIVKQLLDMHGGTVHVASEGLDRGAVFTVRLPLVGADESEPAPRNGDDPAVELGHVRGLVVDDDADARAMVSRLLADRGAQVVQAADVRQAVELLETFRPNVLISDIGMPLQDGFDLIRLVRARESSLPAIALTAYAGAEDKALTLRFGFQLHIAKPIDPAALLQAVARLARA